MRVTVRMPAPNGVAPGQTATFNLPIGRTFHTLLMTYAGVTLAQMTEIRLVANGKVLRRILTGTFQDDINQFCGLAAAAGILRIDLDRPGMRLKDGEEYTSLGTGLPGDPQGVSTLNLEVDIAAAAPAPVLSMKAIQSEPRNFGLVSKYRVFTHAPTGAGDYEIADLPKGDLIGKIIIDDSIVTVNSVRVERDGFVVFERTAAENSLVQADGYRVPQAGYFVIDPSENGFAGEAYVTNGAQDFRLIVNVAGAGAMPVTVEYIGGLGN